MRLHSNNVVYAALFVEGTRRRVLASGLGKLIDCAFLWTFLCLFVYFYFFIHLISFIYFFTKMFNICDGLVICTNIP